MVFRNHLSNSSPAITKCVEGHVGFRQAETRLLIAQYIVCSCNVILGDIAVMGPSKKTEPVSIVWREPPEGVDPERLLLNLISKAVLFFVLFPRRR